MGDAITRSCCCSHGWGCAAARSPRSSSRTSTGAPGELLIRGKGSRQDVLPLPVDVGEAMVSYLRRRPRCESRALFLRMTAPLRGLAPHTVGWIVREACTRAGLPRVGAHRLRHTAATEMLRHGASLAEIGQVLRHREQKTTAIYAKVDRGALRALARPWPSQEGGAA